jgi:lysozyme family protein
MSEFLTAFEKMIKNEGGYQLHTVQGDRGGMTYAGIARKFHPLWPGWVLLDSGERDNPKLTQMVRNFYLEKFWSRVHGKDIKNQAVAENLFDFAVNTGPRVAVKLAQVVAGATPDGAMGPKTVTAINDIDPGNFIIAYAASVSG